MADPLATVADVQSRYPGPWSDSVATRVASLLVDASTVVRTYTRQTFSAAPTTITETIRPIGDRLRLRQAPVTAVTAVGIVDTLQTNSLLVLPMGAWMWDGGQEIWIGAIQTVINLPDEITYLLQYQTPLMRVIYVYGYTTMPDPVVTVVCSMVCRVLDTPGPTSAPSSTVGGLSYRLSAAAQDGVLGLTDAEMRMLAPFRRAATTVELR